MSRVATPQQTQSNNTTKVPHEKVAQRAYEKWCKRGCVHGYDRQDWIDAENEIRTEMMKGSASPQHRR